MALNAKKPHIKPDYHWIRFDETKHWNTSFLAEIGPDARIFATYVFDHNSATNCCEITSSYELHHAGTHFETSRELTEAEREKIEEKISAANIDSDGVSYYHCRSIDNNENNPSHPVRQFVGCDSDVKLEEVIEYYQENPW